MKTSEPLLSIPRFMSSIDKEPSFLAAMPRKKFDDYPRDEQRAFKRRAVAQGALAMAAKQEKGLDGEQEPSLDTSLFKLVGRLDTFFTGSQQVDQLRDDYGSIRDMSERQKNRFNMGKRSIIEFNHAIYDVIDTSDSKFTFSELLEFTTRMRVLTSGPETAKQFMTYAREAITGMRSEVAVARALKAGGVEFKRGSIANDRFGEDLSVNNVGIDVKSSWESTARARVKAEEEGRNPKTIIWAHVTFEDFEGELTLPPEKTKAMYHRIKPDLEAAIASEHQPAYAS